MTKFVKHLAPALLLAIALPALAQQAPTDPKARPATQKGPPPAQAKPAPTATIAVPTFAAGAATPSAAAALVDAALTSESEAVPCAPYSGVVLPSRTILSTVKRDISRTTSTSATTVEKKSDDGQVLRETTTLLLTTSKLTARITTVTAQVTVTTQTFGPLGDPKMFVTRMMDPILEIMRRPEYQDPAKRPALREEVRESLVEASDFSAICALVLSTYANDLGPDHCRELSNRLSLIFYSGFILHLEKYAVDKFEIQSSLSPNPTRARVMARTVNPKEEVPVSFRLLGRPDRWALYDIHVQNVSMLRSFRKQMREILLDRGFNDLIERLDMAVAADPIATYARKLRETGKALGNAVGSRPAADTTFGLATGEGEEVLSRDVRSQVDVSSMSLHATITTTTAWGVPTTMTVCTVYTTRTQSLNVVLASRRVLSKNTAVAAPAPTPTPAIPNDPEGVVRVTVDQVLDILRRKNYRENLQKHRDEIRDTILRSVAMDTVGRLTLSNYISKFSDEEFQEFLHVFASLLLSNYIVHLEKYTDEKVVIDGVRNVSDTRKRVETRTVSDTKEIPIDFSMAEIDGRWMIYDLRVEGVSLVSNFRKQFRSILLRNPPSVLIERIREKVKENETKL